MESLERFSYGEITYRGFDIDQKKQQKTTKKTKIVIDTLQLFYTVNA